VTIDRLSVKRSSAVRTSVVVEGTTAPNAPVVVENQSRATFAPLRTADVLVRTTADAAGRFRVAVPATHEGDHLRVRSAHSVVSIRVNNTAPVDGRPPVVHHQGLRLVPAGDGSFAFTHVRRSTVVGEPKQVVRFKNDRSGDVVDYVLDERGCLPTDARLRGRAGDVFRLATTDGVHNTKFKSGWEALVAPSSSSSSQPPPLAEHAGLKSQRLGGPLCIDVPQPGTVQQGKIGDCWLVSAVDAIAAVNPQRLRALFRENDDGTVTFTLHRYDHQTRRRVTEDVTVTNSALNDGGPVYGSTSTNERWFALLEKAMAGFKGGYEAIVSGYPYEAFEALLGTPGKHHDFDVASPEAVWAALNSKKPQAMATWTRVESPTLSFAKTGLAADHAYAVFGTSERNGERFVTLRNPWGSNKSVWGGTRDGIELQPNGLVSVPLGTFMRLFAALGTASV
jgi:hypothetical protein